MKVVILWSKVILITNGKSFSEEEREKLQSAAIQSTIKRTIKEIEIAKYALENKEVDLDIELITPIAMEKELRFAIREGGHTVGAGVVTEITE